MKTTTMASFLLLLYGATAVAQQTGAHTMTAAADMTWSPGPASLPAGAEVSVLKGNPAVDGVFTMRLRLPANYTIPPHWHPAVEHVTVIDGNFQMGLGERFDRTVMHNMGVGDFVTMDPGTRHFAAAGANGAVIQLHGVGPWQIHYVNRADDPRGAAAPPAPAGTRTMIQKE
jgi:quercetin dioxygenase-like cupin family protein